MSYTIYNEDCINLTRRFRSQEFEIIYLDPPFATGDTQGLRGFSYDDKMIGPKYISFLKNRISRMIDYLSDEGFLLIHLDKHAVYEVKNMVEELGIPFKGDIIWSYRRWSSKISSLQNNHDTILVFSFNQSYKKQRQIISQSIVAPSSNERVGYPTQKPIKLLKRLFTMMSNYTNVHTVLDPFMGSGSTLVAGLELGFEVFGFDQSPDAFSITEERLNTVLDSQLSFSLGSNEVEL